MSHAWTNKVNCVEECIGDTRQASIFLEGAWEADVNRLTVISPLLLSHIDEMLDRYEVLSAVVWWYFFELSPNQIEEYLNVSLDYGVWLPIDGDIISVGYSTLDNTVVQSWVTFEKTTPGEVLSGFGLEIPLTGGGPVYENAGAFVDVKLYVGGYTPYDPDTEADPNIPAGLTVDPLYNPTFFYLNPLLNWGE